MAEGEKTLGLEASLARTYDALCQRRRQWALIGGLAVSARAEPRFTRDIDIVVKVKDDAEAEGLTYELQLAGHRVFAAVEHEATGRLATVRTSFGGASIVDIAFASSGIEAEVAFEANELELLPGLQIPVACVSHLLALKVLSRNDQTRPQDRVDIGALLKVIDPSGLEQTRNALGLITTRGFHRNKNLLAELASALQEFGHQSG